MKPNYKHIFQDGLVLVLASTIFVVVLSTGFRKIKKDIPIDPIVVAINQDSMDAAKEEIAKGSDPERLNKKDEFGRTPLMLAAYANYEDRKQRGELDAKRVAWIEYLIAQGARNDATDNDGWTPLMFAAWSGLNQVTQKLLEQGAGTAAQDRQGNTALILAVMRGNVEIVKQLRAKGADAALVTQKGFIARDYAQDGLKRYPKRAEAYQAILGTL